jgi:hypothetical protein
LPSINLPKEMFKMKALRFPVVLSLVVLSAHMAFAGGLHEPVFRDPGADPQSPAPLLQAHKQRDVAPLLYLLPSLGTNEPATMEIRLLQGTRQLISETVKLPARVPAGATIDVLFTHADELKRLRAIETTTPGSLRFIALVEGRAVTDAPFAAIEAQGANLSVESAVGKVTEVEVRPSPKLRIRALDECTDYCDQQYMSCLDSCDQRSNSCQQCWLDYQACSSNCEPCTEPVSTSDYTTYTVLSVAYFGEYGCYSRFHPTASGDRFEHVYVTLRVTNFHRVNHCDGSHTDTQTSQYDTSYWCWNDTQYSCGSSTSVPPNPQC